LPRFRGNNPRDFPKALNKEIEPQIDVNLLIKPISRSFAEIGVY
jgi:hypothetical protein